MKRLFFVFPVLVFLSCDAPSSNPRKIDTTKIRDTHGGLAGAADTLLTNDKPSSSWEYSADIDKMTDKRTWIGNCLSLGSLDLKFPYNGINYGHILIQNRRGKTQVLLSIDKGQILENDIHVRFDSGKMETYYPSTPGDGDSKYAFLNPSDRMLVKLKRSKHVIIEAELFDNGIQQMEFNTWGLIWPPKDSILK